jgi:histidinol-phosphatase (PHP family)
VVKGVVFDRNGLMFDLERPMQDVHVHFLHGHGGGYTLEFLENFMTNAQSAGLAEIYLLEHTHQFREFAKVYEPVRAYNEYQQAWITSKMNGSIEQYLAFIAKVKANRYPVKVRFGLEVCYIPEKESLLADILDQYSFDFLTGSVHWIDGWGFDHKSEFWQGKDVNKAYRRYYQIMGELVESGLFDGLAHPDSIKCFGYYPSFDLTAAYEELAMLLCKHGMYAEQSGGLALNYGFPELGLNRKLLTVLQANGVMIKTASDAHRVQDVGRNIPELMTLL